MIGAHPGVLESEAARRLALLVNQTCWSLSETGNLELVGDPDISELASNQILGASCYGTLCLEINHHHQVIEGGCKEGMGTNSIRSTEGSSTYSTSHEQEGHDGHERSRSGKCVAR